MVLKAEVRHMVAQAVKEVVIPIMMGSKQLLRLRDKVLVVVEDFTRSTKSCGTVSGNVHLMMRILTQCHHPHKLPGVHGRVHQCGQGYRLKRNLRWTVALLCGLRGNRQRGAELPPCG